MERGAEHASAAQHQEDDRDAGYRPPRQFLIGDQRLQCHSQDPQGDRYPEQGAGQQSDTFRPYILQRLQIEALANG